MNLKLWHKVIIGMVLGVGLAHFYPEQALVLQPIGTLFMNMIKMMVVPLVFFAVLYGIVNIKDTHTFYRIGSKAFVIYMITTVFAVTIGLVFANIFEPGVGINVKLDTENGVAPVTKSLFDIVMNIIPTNIIESMVAANLLQIVAFAFFMGFALISIGDKGKEVKDLINSIAQLVFKMIAIVIEFTPYGVFALMACIVAKHGFGIMLILGKFVLVILGALALQYVLFGVMLFVLAGLNPIPFYRKMGPIQALAFATASSKATLPMAMESLTDTMGVSKPVSSFILPLGASINMDATAIYLGIAAVFFAQMFGIELTFTQYLVLIPAATIGSIGAAGFPGGGIVMMSMVLASVNIPIEGISLILGIDRILDMFRTMINITGDCTVTVLIDKMEGSLDQKVYDAEISQKSI